MAGDLKGRWELLVGIMLTLYTPYAASQIADVCSNFHTAGIFRGGSLHVQFLLYTSHSRDCGQVIQVNGHNTLETSHFNASLGTKIIIHGFRVLGTKPSWIDTLIDALLDVEDVNVLAVDWVHGSTAKYQNAVENVPKLSLEVAVLINSLLDAGATEKSVHLIGASLGAHVAGHVGQLFGGRLGRITGLDPAGFRFTEASPEERLDPGDAVFVEVIHTDTDTFGIRIPVGHVDFYINGGIDQPGCPYNLYKYMICDHMRSVSIYINAVLGLCSYIGYPCPSYDKFHTGECVTCTNSLLPSCPLIGQEQIALTSGNNTLLSEARLFMMTTPRNPYCAHHVLLEFTLTESKNISTNINIQLRSDTYSTRTSINIPRYKDQGKTVVALEGPLCQVHTVVIWVPTTFSSLWRKKPDVSGRLCVSELPMSDRNEMVCLPKTLTLKGNSRKMEELATKCK
ncbi:phospholipase A1 member A isoform X2 [Bombina bombina]|uniref:phospholipase A1 member A isoform X2 n=1 Tax=Bombina bombina TaxID=8345 RepID=UPI00235A6E9C|nr:phospholipase A1 member A isoform X2 [Bombina bombina]